MKKKLYLGILIICLVSFCNRVQAQAFEMDGIYYSVIGADNTAVEVVSPGTGVTYEGDIAIPASVFYGGSTYWVTRIGDGAFRVCYNLTSIELPAGLTSIGKEAFRDCSGLTTIDFPAGLTSIEDEAFLRCGGLTAIELPAGLTSLGESVFEDCRGLTTMDLPAGLRSLGGYAFAGCSGLATINLPAGLTSLGEYVFSNCVSLTSIDLPAGLTTVGGYAFLGCSDLTTIELPAGFTAIAEGMFSGCSGLTSIEMPAGLQRIGWDAFMGTDSLKEIFLWASSWPELDNPGIFEGRSGLVLYTFISEPSDNAAWNSVSEKVVLSVSLGETLHVYDGSVPVSISGNTSSFYMDVIQDSMEVGAGSHQYKELYFWFGKQGDENNRKISKAALPEPYLSYTITKAPLQVTAGSYTMIYGDELPELAFSCEGFVNGEDSTVLVSFPVIACEAGENPDAGEYAITVSGGEADNYEFTEYVAGKLTVEKAAQAIEWNQEFAEEVLAGTEILLEATASSGLGVSYASSNEEVAVIRQEDGQSKVVCIAEGEVEISASQAGDKNHEAAEDVRKTLHVKADVGNEPAWASGIELYPNPVRDELKIKGTNAGMKIRVFHANGHAVSLPQGGEIQASDGLTILRVGSLPSGLYLLQFVQDGQTHVLRFVKN